MKAAVVTATERIEILDVDVPAVKDDEVLIRVHAAGVCGSDLHLFLGRHVFRKPPVVMGHEAAGEIVQVGAAVTKFKVGDRVTVLPQRVCGVCEFCRQGKINICDAKIVPGTPEWTGAFVEYFNAPEDMLFLLADDVGYEVGCLAEPLSVAVHMLRLAREEKRESVVIFGAGSIGMMGLLVARNMGYKTALCTDPTPFNRQLAVSLGATALDPFTEDVVSAALERTGGRGADLALVTAGGDDVLDQASCCVRKGGEIGVIAMITRKIPFYCYGLVAKEQVLYGSMNYTLEDFRKAVDLINGGLDLKPLISHVLPMNRSQEGLELLSRKADNALKVVVTL